MVRALLWQQQRQLLEMDQQLMAAVRNVLGIVVGTVIVLDVPG